MTASSTTSESRTIRVALVLTAIALVGYLVLLLGANVIPDVVYAIGIVVFAVCAVAGLVFGVRALRAGAGRAISIGVIVISALLAIYLLSMVVLLLLLRP